LRFFLSSLFLRRLPVIDSGRSVNAEDADTKQAVHLGYEANSHAQAIDHYKRSIILPVVYSEVSDTGRNAPETVPHKIVVSILIVPELFVPCHSIQLALPIMVRGTLNPMHPNKRNYHMGDICNCPTQFTLLCHNVAADSNLEDEDENCIRQKNSLASNPICIWVVAQINVLVVSGLGSKLRRVVAANAAEGNV